MASYLMLEKPYTLSDLQQFVNLAGKLDVSQTAQIIESDKGIAVPCRITRTVVKPAPVAKRVTTMRHARKPRLA